MAHPRTNNNHGRMYAQHGQILPSASAYQDAIAPIYLAQQEDARSDWCCTARSRAHSHCSRRSETEDAVHNRPLLNPWIFLPLTPGVRVVAVMAWVWVWGKSPVPHLACTAPANYGYVYGTHVSTPLG